MRGSDVCPANENLNFRVKNVVLGELGTVADPRDTRRKGNSQCERIEWFSPLPISI